MKQTKVAISQAAQEILNNITANISPNMAKLAVTPPVVGLVKTGI